LSALGQKLQGGVEVPLGHPGERITAVFRGMERFGAGCRFLGGMRLGVPVRSSDSGCQKRNNWSVAPPKRTVKELTGRPGGGAGFPLMPVIIEKLRAHAQSKRKPHFYGFFFGGRYFFSTEVTTT
jgi:hypothetical protein